MKSQQKTFLIRTYTALSKDIAAFCPSLANSLDRDVKTISHQLEHRGLGVVTLDLPFLDDHLLSGLRDGILPSTDLPFGRIKGSAWPRLCGGMWKMVFHKDGRVKDHVDPNIVFFLRQFFCLFKKLEIPCSLKRTRKSVSEYERIEQSLPNPNLRWGQDTTVFEQDLSVVKPRFSDYLFLRHSGRKEVADAWFSGDRSFETILWSDKFSPSTAHDMLLRLDALSSEFSRRLPHFDPFQCENWTGVWRTLGLKSAFRHGPGAVSDATRDHDKFVFPTWSRRLSSVFPFYPFGASSLHRIGDTPDDYDHPSKLIAVPKTAKGPRLIASEPTANQWCQQQIASYLYDSTEFFRTIVDTKDQSRSREMALQGSRTGEFATIDLSSASDRLSCAVVERIFSDSPSLLSALNAVRTPYINNKMRGTRRFLLRNRKYASQGTACTFPVQSICFALISMAACGYSTLHQARGKVRVFGDDIIVPTHHAEKVRFLLTLLGLSVNSSKSFWSGGFRESCGMDAFEGYDVTPTKFKYLPSPSPKVEQALFDVQNNLHKKGLWHLAEHVRMECKMAYCRPYTRDLSESSNLFTFSNVEIERSNPHLAWRFNYDLQVLEYRVRAVSSTVTTTDRDSLPRLLLNQHSNFGDSFTPELVGQAPTLVSSWVWEGR